MKQRIAIIGSGFSSVAAACYLAQNNCDVHVYEKNAQLGGRARQWTNAGFKFDMGPTWYWMPDVFEHFFADFDRKVSDYYELEKLSPAYRVYYGEDDFIDIADSPEKIISDFEKIETGAGKKLEKFLEIARKNYEIAIKDMVYRPGISPLELVSLETAKRLGSFFKSISKYVRQNFKNPKLIKILEFPVLFLGAKPSNTPFFYNFMNYADFGLGTWYPKGGMRSVIEGMIKMAEEFGVTFHTNSNVEEISVNNSGNAIGIKTGDEIINSDFILSGADYHHTENLLPEKFRNYSEKYWSKKVFSPSSLLFYVGFDKRIKNVLHHTLFFDEDFEQHAVDIYDNPNWPEKPLFYASFLSISDKLVAPEGKEAAIFLIPLAINLEDTEEIRQKYFDLIIDRLEKLTGQSLRENIEFSRSYAINDFKQDYNSYGGNAYGLANILFQTAFLRPKLKSKKVKNLFFAGQLTVPGPGVPPSLISGKLSAELLLKRINSTKS